MVIHIKVSIKRVNQKAKVYILGQMEVFMKEHF